jgi:hypothetical protein
MLLEKGFDGENIETLGFNPEDVVTIFQVKIPTSILVDQSIEKWGQLTDFPNT